MGNWLNLPNKKKKKNLCLADYKQTNLGTSNVTGKLRIINIVHWWTVESIIVCCSDCNLWIKHLILQHCYCYWNKPFNQPGLQYNHDSGAVFQFAWLSMIFTFCWKCALKSVLNFPRVKSDTKPCCNMQVAYSWIPVV